jgi:hypothetical protein
MASKNGGAPQKVEEISFRGYFSRAAAFKAPPGYFTGDAGFGSFDWRYMPRDAAWTRRKGSVIKGDTFGAQVGILPAHWSAKGRQVLELLSDSLTDGNPTVLALWTNESTIWGQLAFYNTNTAAWQVIGSRFATDYPITGGTTPNRFRMVPLYSDNALMYTRCVIEKQRRMLFSGARQAIASGTWLYAFNNQGSPIRWNRQFNDASTTAWAEKVWPAGHLPPLRPPSVTTTAPASAGGYEPWNAEDRFILTQAFRFEDGSISRPFIPRPITAVPVIAGAGLVPPQNVAGWVTALGVLPGDAGKKYAYVQYGLFAGAPPGAVSRILMRTPKVDQTKLPSLYSSAQLLQLGVIAEIPLSVTFYNDFDGNDSALFVDSTNIRFGDHKWPRRARAAFSFDGRYAVCGKLKANPGALIVAPWTVGVTTLTQDDSNPDLTANWFVVVREDQVAVTYKQKLLLLGKDATYPSTGIDLTLSSNTLTQITDAILSSLSGATVATVESWSAQIVPGVDGTTAGNNIAYTQVYANFITVLNSSTITAGLRGDGAAGNVANVVVGMAIEAVSGIPAGTYVGSVNVGAKTIGLVDVNGVAVLATQNHAGPTGVPLRIGWDMGDAKPGEIRAINSAYPVVLYFTKAYLDSLPVEESALDFTGADPGHAKYAANAWYVKNRRDVPARAGRAMGGGEVDGGAVVYYTRGKAFLLNPRAGNTNLDDDWKLTFVIGSRGCISSEIVQGNGWVAALTPEGIEITDRTQSKIISGEIFDPSEKTGDLAYEIAQCRAAAIAGTDGGQFHMALSDARLYVSYRSSSNADYPDRCHVYDFSPSAGVAGVPETLTPEGRPYPWGTPYRLRVGCMGEVQDATATHLYGMIDANAGSTGDGRVDEFEHATLTTDNAVNVTPVGYLSMKIDEALGEFRFEKLRMRYRKNGTGLTFGLSADKARSRIDSLQADTSGSGAFTIRRLPGVDGSRSPREVLEFSFSDDGTGDRPELFGGLAEVHRLEHALVRR